MIITDIFMMIYLLAKNILKKINTQDLVIMIVKAKNIEKNARRDTKEIHSQNEALENAQKDI